MARLIAWTFGALYPATAGMPGAADTDALAFARTLLREAPFLFKLGLVLGCWVFLWSPLITVYWPVPAVFLPAETLDRHAERICAHRIYLVRQAMFLVKLSAGMCWAAHPAVRAKWALEPYPPDPGTFRGATP